MRIFLHFLRKVAVIAWKDIRSEFRTKETMSLMLIFSLLVAVVFSFALDAARGAVGSMFPGVVWVAFIFAGLLGLNRSFSNEKPADCLQGLMLCPVDRSVIYFGKVTANLVFMAAMELVSFPVFLVLFDARFQGSVPSLIAVLFLGSLGFVSIGTFLSALAANTRASEVLLPIMLLPVAVPVVIAGVQGVNAVFAGGGASILGLWLRMLVAYDVVFLVVPFLLFEYCLEV